MPDHDKSRQNSKATPSRRNASPRGLARPKACVGVTGRGREQDRLAVAAEVEPCRCPLVPLAGNLHDLLRRINGDEWDDEVRSGAWEEPRKRRTRPLPPEYRLTAWVMGLEPCHHVQARGRLKRPGDVQAWLDLVALWADVLRRSDGRGYRDRPEPRPVTLPMSPAGRVGIYAARAEAGKSCFSRRDTVAVPPDAKAAPAPDESAKMGRAATLAEARARGAARREGWHMGGEGQ